MLLTELILSKRGPLAKVWLSAHHERKLSKQQALGVDVGESVDAILTQDDGPTTLRLSGQLMLGVTRIYSRKVQYLLDDCKETRERITLAFRPGIVDLPEDQIRASKNAITFTDTRNDFDFFDWTWTAPEPVARNALPAPQASRGVHREFGEYNFGRPAAPSIYGDSTTASRQGSIVGDDSSHLDSQDFGNGIDLGLDLDNFDAADLSMEIGRRESGVARSQSVRSGFERDRSLSLLGMSGGFGSGMDDFGQVDLGLNLDDLELPELDRRRRESSALSTPPPVSPPAEVSMTEITPRTAAKVAKLADAQDKATQAAATQDPAAAPPKKKVRLLMADEELELPDSQFAAPGEDSHILGEEAYIPSDPVVVRLNEIMLDPAEHFMPTMKVGNETMFYAGPEGLAPALAELFAFPTNILRRNRGEDGADEAGDRQAKRAKTGAVGGSAEDWDVEVARRASVAPSELFPAGLGGEDSFAFQPDQGMDAFNPDMDIEIPLDMLTTPSKARQPRQNSMAPSRAGSVARDSQYDPARADFTLAMFDSRYASRDAESSSQLETPSKSVSGDSQARSARSGAPKPSGVSKNTTMAMNLLRRELEAIEDVDAQAEDEKVVAFEKVAEKATKRAAASFFFELLVLGTKDCVKLDQTTALGDIQVRGKNKLFDQDILA